MLYRDLRFLVRANVLSDFCLQIRSADRERRDSA